jgi:hypothetical protein
MAYKSLNKKLKEHREEKKQHQEALDSEDPADARHHRKKQTSHTPAQVKRAPADQSASQQTARHHNQGRQHWEGKKSPLGD